MSATESAGDASDLKQGLPYSSHDYSSVRRPDNVIYIPSNGEELDAEISRLAYVDRLSDEDHPGSRFDSYLAREDEACIDMGRFMPQGSPTKRPGVFSTLGRNGTKWKGPECENSAAFKSLGGCSRSFVAENEYTCVSLDESYRRTRDSGLPGINMLECVDDVPLDTIGFESVMGIKNEDNVMDAFGTMSYEPALHSLKGNLENNFVEINILSVEPENNTGVDDKSPRDLNELNKYNLRTIVRKLIGKIFESPRKGLKYTALKSSYGRKQREVKISVDELFKDDKLNFIVENPKKADKFASILSSKKFLFLQLCCLAIVSIFFMSYYSAIHRVAF